MPDKETVRPLARHLVAEKAVEPHGARRILRQAPLAPMLMGGSDVLREKVEVELIVIFLQAFPVSCHLQLIPRAIPIRIVQLAPCETHRPVLL